MLASSLLIITTKVNEIFYTVALFYNIRRRKLVKGKLSYAKLNKKKSKNNFSIHFKIVTKQKNKR